MVKRALLLVASVAAVLAVAATANAIVARPNPPAPRTQAKALRILTVDIVKLARDYKHGRYRAVCAHLSKRERKHLGTMGDCTLKVALINALVPIKKFAITSAKFSKARTQAVVSLYVNGSKKQLVHAVVKWEGGAYRLDHMSGWQPQL